ncbi:hypothetical protein DSO57_1020979 [Entomophthora muscae]|uniref:Uncharacterized protein n=1 Tax=Entomophthora muscae TaxID=34485 RepID=A0ACC2UQ68_9FUNG|nr:hypothetical protein DSO57_1020979 [Entomophthora muscae]
MYQFADGEYPNIDIPLVTNCSLLNTLFYLICLGFLHSITPFVTQYRFLSGFCKIILQTVPTFLYLLNLNPNALHALVYNLAPLWARPYSSLPINQLLHPTHTTRANPSSAEKDESTLATEKLAHAHSLGPKVIIIDFEQAQFRAFKATFNGEVQGCFFHFRQALIKNLKSNKELFGKYLNDGKGKCCFAITQFAALAFVRLENTGIGFEALLEDVYVKKHSSIFKGYLDYFKRQWVGKKVTAQRRKSRATAPWDCQGPCLKGG